MYRILSEVENWPSIPEDKWSDEMEFNSPEFRELCVWKECPDDVDEEMKYSVDKENPRIATKTWAEWSTVVGNTPLPLNKVTSWNIKVLKSVTDDGHRIEIGIAPFDVKQNECNYNNCGWYFDCGSSTLSSGPPHNYKNKEYGPKERIW